MQLHIHTAIDMGGDYLCGRLYNKHTSYAHAGKGNGSLLCCTAFTERTSCS